MRSIQWTHPSVLKLLDEADVADPYSWVEQRARDLAVEAMEKGWQGPPYDVFELAEILGLQVVARQDLDDARLVAQDDGARIEFNPQRRPARIRFSIAHEIGHWLFQDYGRHVRYRDIAQRKGDDWQLEVLCNVAAAELLMPVGALSAPLREPVSLIQLLEERTRFGVSTEALLRRVVRLTDVPTAMFAAARDRDGAFRIDYVVASRALVPPIRAGETLPASSVLSRCTAVGYADDAVENWAGASLHVQAVGIPPYPGDPYPRVVGLIRPEEDAAIAIPAIRYVRGDATRPPLTGPGMIVHVVNNRARTWGGHGFASALRERFPAVHDDYIDWYVRHGRLGEVHICEAADGLWVASMVAQAGYGQTDTDRPRLRLTALAAALRTVAESALARSTSVHMPLIGTGQGGTPWPRVRDLVLEELGDRHVPVTVYLLPQTPLPTEVMADGDQLSLL